MSSQAEIRADESDGTEELPVLDVVAYEASMIQPVDEMSRTDSWDVGALRTINMLTGQAALAVGHGEGASLPSAELTGDVGAILERIRDLEFRIVEAGNSNASLEGRCATLVLARDGALNRITELEAENARLSEHREIGAQMISRLEGRLREQAVHSSTQIADLQSLRESEARDAEQQHHELQQQLSDQGRVIQALQQEREDLATKITREGLVAADRSRYIEQIQDQLFREQYINRHLTGQLAGKVIAYDEVAQSLRAKDEVIAKLQITGEALGTQLRAAVESGHEIRLQLDSSKQQIGEHQNLLDRRAIEIADRDGRISHLTKEIEQANATVRVLTGDLGELGASVQSLREKESAFQTQTSSLGQEVLSLRTALSDSRSQVTANEKEIAHLQNELAGARDSRESAQALSVDAENRVRGLQLELHEARTAIECLSTECESLRPLQNRLAEAITAQGTADDALARVTAEFQDARQRIDSQELEIGRLREEQATFRQALTDLASERESLRTAAMSDRDDIAKLHSQLQKTSIALQIGKQKEAESEKALQLKAQEVAVLRFELAEHERRTDRLEQALANSQREHAAALQEATDAQQRAQTLARQLSNRMRRTSELKAELTAYTASLAAIRRTLAHADHQASEAQEQVRILEPVEHNGPVIPINRPVTTVGRTRDNDVCVPMKVVSRRHARLMSTPTGVIIEDAGSKNGCFVNGRQIRHQLIRDGDILALGNLRFRLASQTGNRGPAEQLAALPAIT